MKSKIITMLAMAFSITAKADIRLPALVGDNMVLQQQKPLLIWGWADKGETIKLSFRGKQYQTVTGETGKFTIKVAAQKAGGPFTMSFTGKNSITINNILVGDVWLCSGQSNMFFKTREASNAAEEMAGATNPGIRLFSVPNRMSALPFDNIKSKWEECKPATAGNFSAVGYFFGRNIHEKTGIPIGLIHSAFGGTAAEAWISAEGMAGEPEFHQEAANLKHFNLDSAQKLTYNIFHKWADSIDNADPFYAGGSYEVAKQLHAEWPVIKLPSYFERSIESLKNKDGIVWFSTSLNLLPQDIADTCMISFKVDDDDLVFINGVKVGATRDGKYTTRNYAVPKSILQAGSNSITIRVIDYHEAGGFAGKGDQFIFKTPHRIIPLEGNWNYKMTVDTVFKKVRAQSIHPEHLSTVLYNAMIAPLTNYPVKGVIWYQGESNGEKGYQYRSLFQRLIIDWRNKFNEPLLPFLFVQLANWRPIDTTPVNSQWAELREAQTMALQLPMTGMAVAIDIGEVHDIHPKNKQDIAYRLALQARKIVYNEKDLLASGPSFKHIHYTKNKCTLLFKDDGLGLKTSDNTTAVKGFQIATGESEFVYADAFIKGKNSIEIQSPNGKPITAVRYAWANNPGALNLINSSNLPAIPFRTDNFKELSYDSRYNRAL